jgi:hypothetical protein
VPHVEQELFTLPEHLISSQVFSGVRVARSLVFFIIFVDHCLSCIFLLANALSVLYFSFGQCIVCPLFFFWPMHCLSFIFLSANALSVLYFSFGQCIVCPLFFFRPIHCLSFIFLSANALSVLSRLKVFDYLFCIFKPFVQYTNISLGNVNKIWISMIVLCCQVQFSFYNMVLIDCCLRTPLAISQLYHVMNILSITFRLTNPNTK